MGVQVVEPVVGVVEQRLERAEAGVDALLADREQLRLGAVDRLLDLGRILVADAGDPAGGADQVAEDRLALDDPGVLDGMDGGRRLVREAREVGPAADRLELVAALEGLGDRDDVDRLAPLEQLEDGGVDAAVRLAVEVRRAQELGDLDDRVAVDEDGARGPTARPRDSAAAGGRSWLLTVAAQSCQVDCRGPDRYPGEATYQRVPSTTSPDPCGPGGNPVDECQRSGRRSRTEIGRRAFEAKATASTRASALQVRERARGGGQRAHRASGDRPSRAGG